MINPKIWGKKCSKPPTHSQFLTGKHAEKTARCEILSDWRLVRSTCEFCCTVTPKNTLFGMVCSVRHTRKKTRNIEHGNYMQLHHINICQPHINPSHFNKRIHQVSTRDMAAPKVQGVNYTL